MNIRVRFALFAACCLLTAAPATQAAPAPARPGEIQLDVDASEASRKILHVRMRVPATPGEFSLSYPKWIPGEHGPTGPITDVAGVRFTASGRPLEWRRDPVDMVTFRMTVPAGASAVEATFDFVLAAPPEGFSSAASVSENVLMLSWNQVVLYPSGRSPEDLVYRASLTLPRGWGFGTSLTVSRGDAPGGRVAFEPVSLATLVDAPVLTGRYFRRIDLAPNETPARTLDMACDSEAGLAIPPAQVDALRRLAREGPALFGATHFRHYDFLLTMSDHTAHFGLEHHESSDDRVHERIWLDDDIRLYHSNLLAHEYTHSWNGKYRRPAGLATLDFERPMQGRLLWVYEGLTEYIGWVLAGRSGIRTREESLQELARVAAWAESRRGRDWRPLEDTGVEAQKLYEAAHAWESWRRGVDFYDESLLVWLEADVLIRSRTNGVKSLDDFCHAFHGAPSGPPAVVPYEEADVIAALNRVLPYDWATFFDTRMRRVQPHAPLGGVTAGGWTLAWTDSLPALLHSYEEVSESLDESQSLGFDVSTKDGTIGDVIPGSPAALAGVAPNMKLVAVNGRRWTKDVLRDALKASPTTGRIELIVENGDFFRTCPVRWSGGPHYPKLERAPAKHDWIGDILTARVSGK